MIQENQCFVRAINTDAKWDSVDVLNLTDESFRRFILTKLSEIEVIATIRQQEDEEEKPLYERKGLRL